MNLYYTDGAFRQLDGRGAWSFVKIVRGKVISEKSGPLTDPSMTSNQAELTAVFEALKDCEPGSTIISDSAYVVGSLGRWAYKWEANGWRRKERGKWLPVSNSEKMREAFQLAKAKQAEFKWVKGHSGDTMNERANTLCSKVLNEAKPKRPEFTKCLVCMGHGRVLKKTLS